MGKKEESSSEASSSRGRSRTKGGGSRSSKETSRRTATEKMAHGADRSKAIKAAKGHRARSSSGSCSSPNPPKHKKGRDETREKALMGKPTRTQEEYERDFPVKESAKTKELTRKMAELIRDREEKRTRLHEEELTAKQLEMEQLLLEQDAELAASRRANRKKVA